MAQIESVTADLLAGADGLSYGTGPLGGHRQSCDRHGASGFTSIAGIENVTGGRELDLLTGNGARQRAEGNGGNDTLIGGLGTDMLTGGTGTDTASYAGETGHWSSVSKMGLAAWNPARTSS